jgi:hypothetical protein
MTRVALLARAGLRVCVLPGTATPRAQAAASSAPPPAASLPAGVRVEVDARELEHACTTILAALSNGEVLSAQARQRAVRVGARAA